MRPALLLSIVLLAACGDAGTAERLSSKETLDGIDVPTIGTVGDFPDPANRIVVDAKADGRVTVDGAAYATFRALVDELLSRGARIPGEVIIGTNPPKRLSDASVVLRADGALPWGAAQRLVMACAESNVWRVSFAVRHEGDGAEGALCWALQKDKGCDDPDLLAWKTVDVVPGGGDGSLAALYAALSDSPASFTGKLGVRLRLDRRLPTRVVFASIDAAVRVGAASVEVEFERRPPRRDETFASAVEALRAPSPA